MTRSGSLRPVLSAGPYLALVAAGLVVFLAGLFVAPGRAWAGWLVGVRLLTDLAIAGVFFIAVVSLAGGRWASGIRSVPEAMSRVLPWAAFAALPLAAGAGWLYEWADPAAVQGDHLLEAKAAWLHLPFLAGRVIAVYVFWIVLARPVVREGRLNAVFLLVFAPTFSLLSWDLLMSRDARWFSTIFAAYDFSGMFCAGLAALTLLAILLRRRGPLRGVLTEDHLHDLGKLLFAMCSFWAYLWYSQYMLIWYSNLPEEAGWYVLRAEGVWAPLFWLNPLVNWVIPFVVLLPRAAKRNEDVLLRICGVVLAGRWLDLTLAAVPDAAHPAQALGLWELGAPVAALAAFFLLALRAYSAPVRVRPGPEPA